MKKLGVKSVHGTNPTFLVETILRNRIYNYPYWKEECLGLTPATLVEKAIELKDFGGTYGGNRKPTRFICLILKMLQIQPPKEVIQEFITNEDHRYVRILGAFYLRLIGQPLEIYGYLEPLLIDYRKLRKKVVSGKHIRTYVDEFIDELLTEDMVCDIILPRIPKRMQLERQGLLEPRVSFSLALESEGDDDEEHISSGNDSASESEKEQKRIKKQQKRERKKKRKRKKEESEAEEQKARKRQKPDDNPDDEIAQMNKLRAKLGLAPLDV